jgi:hypothetical protein
MTEGTKVVVKEAGSIWKSSTTKWVVVITGIVLGVPLMIGGIWLLYKVIKGKFSLNPMSKLTGMGMDLTNIGQGFNLFQNGFGAKLSTLTKGDISGLLSGKLTSSDFARKIKLDKPIQIQDKFGNTKLFKKISNKSVAKQISKHQAIKPKNIFKAPKPQAIFKPKKSKSKGFKLF